MDQYLVEKLASIWFTRLALNKYVFFHINVNFIDESAMQSSWDHPILLWSDLDVDDQGDQLDYRDNNILKH